MPLRLIRVIFVGNLRVFAWSRRPVSLPRISQFPLAQLRSFYLLYPLIRPFKRIRFGARFVPWSGTWIGRSLCVPPQISSFLLWHCTVTPLSPRSPGGLWRLSSLRVRKRLFRLNRVRMILVVLALLGRFLMVLPLTRSPRRPTGLTLILSFHVIFATYSGPRSFFRSSLSRCIRVLTLWPFEFGAIHLSLIHFHSSSLFSSFVLEGFLCYSGTVNDIRQVSKILYSNYKNLYWFYYLIRIFAHLPRLPALLPPFHFILLTQRKEEEFHWMLYGSGQ